MTDEAGARPKRAARPATPTGATIHAEPKARPPAPKRPVAVPVVVDAPTAEDSRLTILQGGVGRLTAADVSITQGGIGAVRADRVSVELGGVGAAMTDQLDVHQGVVGAVIARDAAFEQAGVRTLIANRVHFGPNSGAGVVFAARVDGDVRTLLDWRGAIAFGAAAGVVMALLRGRRR
jgi:hypothetical protein